MYLQGASNINGSTVAFIFDVCCLSQPVSSNNYVWINSELKKGMRDRDAAKRKAMASNDPRDWAKYKKLRNTINNNIKTSKASYYSNAFSQSKGNSRIMCKPLRAYFPSHQQYNGERTEVEWFHYF